MVVESKQDQVLDYLAAIVTGIWAASMIVDMFSDKYTPPLMTHLILMLVVGFVFGFKKRRHNK